MHIAYLKIDHTVQEPDVREEGLTMQSLALHKIHILCHDYTEIRNR